MPRKEGRNKNRQGGKYQRSDGRWDGYITVDSPEGPRKMRTTKATEDQIDEWLEDIRYEARKGYLSFDATTMTVGQFTERWLEDSIKPTVRRVTYQNYEKTYRLRIQPYLGRHRLRKLSPAHVNAWRSRLLSDGHTPQEVRKAIQLLRRVLGQAAAWEMIPKNPAEHVKAPGYRPKESAYVRAEDLGKYLAATREDPYHALYVLAATAGLRPAEYLALRWGDYDEARGTLRVERAVSVFEDGPEWGAPKTEKGRRTIPLTREARRALSEHRKTFLERRLKLRYGERMDPEKALIFPSQDDPSGAKVYQIDALRRRWYSLLDRAGLPRVTLYALRHTAAMLQARIGTDLKTTQGLMGHANISTTLDIYSHYEEERAQEAMGKLDDLLGGFSGGSESGK